MLIIGVEANAQPVLVDTGERFDVHASQFTQHEYADEWVEFETPAEAYVENGVLTLFSEDVILYYQFKDSLSYFEHEERFYGNKMPGLYSMDTVKGYWTTAIEIKTGEKVLIEIWLYATEPEYEYITIHNTMRRQTMDYIITRKPWISGRR
jgi:hypothetical protein